MEQYNEMYSAAMKGDLQTIKRLSNMGYDIHLNNEAILRLSSEYGHLELVEYLIDNGSNVNANNNEPLIWAIRNGHVDIVKFLVLHNANIHVSNDLALRIAAENENKEIVEYLVKKWANDLEAPVLSGEKGRLEFDEVLNILMSHGHEIMMKLVGNKNLLCLKRDAENENRPFDEDMYMYYDCYDGGDFIPRLFSSYEYKQTMLDDSDERYDPLEKGYVYHCKLNIYGDVKNFATDQVHYFTIVFGEKVILIHTYGGTKGILVKRIYSDINYILGKIINGYGSYYKKIFEIPLHMEHVLSYKIGHLFYIKQALVYPTLNNLNKILKPLGLDFAKDKLEYWI